MPSVSISKNLHKSLLRKTNRIIGTPDYIAPEIIKCSENALNNPKLDIWSLGVILFEFLVGIPPFTSTSIKKIFKKITELKIPWHKISEGDLDE